jgi:hypothetical protein
MVSVEGVEPSVPVRTPGLQPGRTTIGPITLKMAPLTGFEPAFSCLEGNAVSGSGHKGIKLATPTRLELVPTSVTGMDTTLCYGAIKLGEHCRCSRRALCIIEA